MSDITELDVSKDLASFMESLLQETKAPGIGKDGLLTVDELRSFSVTIKLRFSIAENTVTLVITYAMMRSALVCYV